MFFTSLSNYPLSWQQCDDWVRLWNPNGIKKQLCFAGCFLLELFPGMTNLGLLCKILLVTKVDRRKPQLD